MKCLRCGTEMKQYEVNGNLGIYGAEHKSGTAILQTQHNPQSVFECEKCGYMEFSSKKCNNPDI